MTSTQAIRVLLIAGCCAGCVAVDPASTCVDLPSSLLQDVDVDDLSVIIGAPPGSFSAPQVVIQTYANDALLSSVWLRASTAPHPMPETIDESECDGVDWKSYSLSIDQGNWGDLWANPNASKMSVIVVPADSKRWIRVNQFGMILTNGPHAESLMSCGCIAQ